MSSMIAKRIYRLPFTVLMVFVFVLLFIYFHRSRSPRHLLPSYLMTKPIDAHAAYNVASPVRSSTNEIPFVQGRKPIESDLNDLPKERICIEKNICKERESDKYYRHERLPNFIDLIDYDIRYGVQIYHTEYVVPNIVHFVQFSNGRENNFEFHHMLSVLSAYKYQKPDRIYFWLDQEPESRYWIALRKMVPMYLIIRERPTFIRGQRVFRITTVSDIIRMEVLIEYGGMYFDLDVIVVRSFDSLRRYEFTMGKESRSKFCNAVLVSKPWSDFLRLWHKEYVTLDDSVWAHHAGKVPYILSRNYPWMIHVEDSSFFRPAYYELDYLIKEGKLYNWRELNYCVHLWIRFFKEKRTGPGIDSWNTTVGELYRYILYDDWRLRKNFTYW